MTIQEVRDEIALVKSQIAASGGVSSKSLDGASVSLAVGELYRRLQYLEELENKILASRRSMRCIDISDSLSPPSPTPPSGGNTGVGDGTSRPMTANEMVNLIDNVTSRVFH